MIDVREVRTRLGWPDAAQEILDTWDALGAPDEPVRLPERSEVIRILHRMGAEEIDVADVVTSPPDPEADPVMWWVLERCVQHLRSDMGGQSMLSWPSLADQRDARTRLTYLYAFLAHLPTTLAWHAERGIPEEVSWATFGDVGEKLRTNRQIYGEAGIDVAFWFTLHFRGSIYRLGRLQFEMHMSEGEPVLGVHIPESGGPMSPEACDASFAWAAEFYPRHFPEHGAKRATCLSWLLDPRLDEVLPESNIAAFGRRFERFPAKDEAGLHGTLDVLRFVFKTVVSAPEKADLDALPRDNRLQRALIDHMVAGGRWEQRGGSVPLPQQN